MSGLREPLVTFLDKEGPDAFLKRALAAAKEAGGSGRLRLEVGSCFSLNDGGSHKAVSLWVERGRGSTESWQRVTGSVIGDAYAPLLKLFAKALDA